MATVSASEVQSLTATVQNRSILNPKGSQVISNTQNLFVPKPRDTLGQGIGGGLQALDIINITNVTVDTPFLIWAQPSNMLVASHTSNQRIARHKLITLSTQILYRMMLRR